MLCARFKDTAKLFKDTNGHLSTPNVHLLFLQSGPFHGLSTTLTQLLVQIRLFLQYTISHLAHVPKLTPAACP